MSGFFAGAATVVLIAAAAAAAAYDDTAAMAAYSLNGQNVEWPGPSARNAYAADTGRYVAKNVMATRAQVWRDRAFVLTPRFRSGVPFTVSAVRLDCRRPWCRPALSPYPGWWAHAEDDTAAVQNAVDMHMDPTGVLWLLDIGLVNTMEQPVRRTRPRVFAVDVETDEVSGGRADASFSFDGATNRRGYHTV